MPCLHGRICLVVHPRPSIRHVSNHLGMIERNVETLWTVLHEIAPDGQEGSTTERLGRWIASRRGRIVGWSHGSFGVRTAMPTANTWFVEQISDVDQKEGGGVLVKIQGITGL